ncbi:MAG TPA: DUF4126 domain-containing protein [Flavihumibacter sp.]|nr:DUF4126 domain-containing protein [Flavihumibacter sp.]
MNAIFLAIAMGIGLSACCGFRVFLPMLVAALAARAGVLPVQEGMAWLYSWPAIITLGTATVLEILGYYIPFIDNLLDTMAAPLAIGAGTLLAFSVFPTGEMDAIYRWGLALLAGGSLAGTIQIGSGLLRLLSSKTTAGMGNAAVATGENLAALGGSLASLWIPVIAALLLLLLCAWLSIRIFRHFYFGKKP